MVAEEEWIDKGNGGRFQLELVASHDEHVRLLHGRPLRREVPGANHRAGFEGPARGGVLLYRWSFSTLSFDFLYLFTFNAQLFYGFIFSPVRSLVVLRPATFRSLRDVDASTTRRDPRFRLIIVSGFAIDTYSRVIKFSVSSSFSVESASTSLSLRRLYGTSVFFPFSQLLQLCD